MRRPPRHSRALTALLAVVATAAHADEATVALRWTHVPDAAGYELQIAIDPRFSRLVVNERLAVAGYRWSQLPRQRYFWRVRSVDAQGRLGDWSAVRTIEPAVGPPSILAPRADERVAQGAPLRVEVSASPLIREHVLETSTDPRFRRHTRRSLFSGTRSTIPPEALALGTLYLRVRGVDLTGRETAWSAATAVQIQLAAPVLRAPLANETLPWSDPPQGALLQWDAVAGADGYQVAVANAGRPERQRTTTRPQHRMVPAAPGAWQWRVRATRAGVVGAWSERRTLRVALPAPELLSPDEGRTIETRTGSADVALRWRAVSGATHYAVELSRDLAFPPQETRSEQTATDDFVVAEVPTGRWFARVVAHGAGSSSTSTPRSFIIEDAPLEAPTPLSPAEGEAMPRGEIRLAWTPVPSALRYELELDPPQAIAPVVTPEARVAASREGEHRFRVRARDESGRDGPWSRWRAYRVGVPPAARAEVSLSHSALRADGRSAAALLFRLLDAQGRPIEGARPEVTASAGTLSAITEEDGLYALTYVAPPVAPEEGRVAIEIRDRQLVAATHLQILAPDPRWLVGGDVGWNLTLGALSSPFLGVSADARLPWLEGRVWALARAGFYGGGRAVELPSLALDAQAQIGRVSILGAVRLPLRTFELYAGLGPSLQWARVTLGEQQTAGGAVGGQALFGGQYRVGPGVASAELSYTFGALVTDDVRLRTGGATVAVGYRVGLR